MPEFHDDSTDCAICLEPLVLNANDNEETATRRVLTLQCGHKWHYDCLVQQLQTAQSMTTSRSRNQRLIFTGCQCAKCGQICEHEELDHLTRMPYGKRWTSCWKNNSSLMHQTCGRKPFQTPKALVNSKTTMEKARTPPPRTCS